MLPVFAVDTEEDARDLLVASCATNLKGEFVAQELLYEQTLENLDRFSERLQTTWERIQANRARKKKDAQRSE